MSLACPQDGIRVVSETFKLNTLFASWTNLGFSIRNCTILEAFLGLALHLIMTQKSAQDGLRVDQPEWSEFASLEEPIEGTVDGCVFSWGNSDSERFDHRSTCFICQIFVDVVY